MKNIGPALAGSAGPVPPPLHMLYIWAHGEEHIL